MDAYSADSIAIKVAIEFCLAINASFFLFTDIFNLFCESGLENKFLQHLEPFILSGAFRKEMIPEKIMGKIIGWYEGKGNMRGLERVIMQLDMGDYSRKEELMVTCQVHCMISALLYLMATNAEESLGCMQILNTLITLMRKASNIDIDKDDIALVCKVDSQKKYDIEKSRVYIGYKLLWIVKTFIEGKTFPTG